MNSDIIPVEPSVITEVKTITNFRLSVQELELFLHVLVRAELLNADGNLVDVRYVLIDGDDYKNWNNDDQYLIDKVAQKLGLVVLPVHN